MPTVEVTFTPLAAHVRTARLVATAVARRTGVPETMLDEVRLAVGEACSRAVEAHQAAGQDEPVRVTLSSDQDRLEIEVQNIGPAGQDSAPYGLSLAVIAGLADDVQINQTAAGTSVRMSWPVPGQTPASEELAGSAGGGAVPAQ
jgi:serine/threonine-protein kinase RsbW